MGFYMRDALLKLLTDKLKTAERVVKEYDLYLERSNTDIFDQIPISSIDCRILGEFAKELGGNEGDFELLGIGQSLIEKIDQLALKECSRKDATDEALATFLTIANQSNL